MGKRNEGRWRDKQPIYQGTLTTPAGTAHRFAIGEAAAIENRDRDAAYQAWAMENFAPLAAMSWMYYQTHGRCALVARFGPDGRLVGDVEPITPAQLAASRTRSSAKMITSDLATYDPERDMVLAAVERSASGEETTWVYKMRSETATPPDAYESLKPPA